MLSLKKKISLSVTTVIVVGCVLALGLAAAGNTNDKVSLREDEDECDGVAEQDDPCEFVREFCEPEGFVNYLEFHYCTMADYPVLSVILQAILLTVMFIFLGVCADEYFAPLLAAIAEILRIPEDVAGVTFLALGNGAPDLSASIVALQDESSAQIAFGALGGAGMFVCAVVVGTVCFVSPFEVERRPFLRDVLFLMASVAYTTFMLWDGKVTLWEAIMFFGVYVVYVSVVIIFEVILKRRTSPESDVLLENVDDPTKPSVEVESIQLEVGSVSFRHMSLKDKIYTVIAFIPSTLFRLTIPTLDERWNPRLALLHPVGSPLLLLLISEEFLYDLGGGFPMFVLVLVGGLIVSGVMAYLHRGHTGPRFRLFWAMLGFAAAVGWIFFIAEELVDLLQSLGLIVGISDAMLGLTILAWGNSIGDMVANVAVARLGFAKMAMGACYGGPLLNLLIGIGVGCIIKTGQDGDLAVDLDVILAVGLAFLLGTLMISLVAISANSFSGGRVLGGALFVLYLAFLASALGLEFS